jgi:hypothetical protein
MSFCALAASSQKLGFSDCAFRTSRRLRDESQSKMPPQQVDRLLDFECHRLDLGAHAAIPSLMVMGCGGV